MTSIQQLKERDEKEVGGAAIISRNTESIVHHLGVNSQVAFLKSFFVTLDVIPDCKVGPALEANTAFGVFARFGHVFLDILERSDSA